MTTLPQEQRPGFNPWFLRLPLLLVMGGLLLGMTLLSLLFAYQIAYTHRIVPGVSSYGVPLGGLTPVEATDALSAAFDYTDETVFTFRHENDFWQFTAAELGVTLDAEATAQTAFGAGRGLGTAADLSQRALIWLGGLDIPPVVRYDQSVALVHLYSIASEIDQRPQEAALMLDGAGVQTASAREGRALDVSATLVALEEKLIALEPGGEVPLTVEAVSAPAEDVEATAAYIRTALSGPVSLFAMSAEGQQLGPWTVSVAQIEAVLDIERATDADGNLTHDVTADVRAFEDFLHSLAPGLIVPAKDGRFVYNDDLGELETLVPAQDGREINVEETLVRLEAAIFSAENRVVPIAFDFTKPRYHNDITAAELGITGLVSESTTLYSGSTAARRTNIARGATLFNGVIIGPGEEFSFNQWVGDISEENGFVEGAIIFGGRTVKGIGGGVCQVSTTAFRAAFYAGFPIIERHSHGYRVGYYELGNEGVGMDAAIYTPTADFRFMNDTDYHLLIETEDFPERDAVAFRFYSTNPGRQVVKENQIVRNTTPALQTIYEPNAALQPGQSLQVDWAAEGADVTVTRLVLDMDGNVINREDIHTHYQPWSAVVQVAPGDNRLG